MYASSPELKFLSSRLGMYFVYMMEKCMFDKEMISGAAAYTLHQNWEVDKKK